MRIRVGELYDFNGGPGTYEARILEDAGRARPFLVDWLRPERVSATIVRDGETWRLEEPARWQKLDPGDADDPDAWFAED